MQLSSPIYHLKRKAKLLSRERGLPLHQALDRTAVAEGFKGWSHLAASHAEQRPADRILSELQAGDMLLLGARPGHGKTMIGLELALLAPQIRRSGFVFTLDYTEGDVLGRLAGIVAERRDSLSVDAASIDASDAICADYIIEQLEGDGGSAIVVIDYLQLLDQRRSTPELGDQIQALKAVVEEQGAIIVMISQIDRTFEASDGMPGLGDVRLPNPIDLTLFNKTCFVHGGRIQLDEVA
ncbi:MAG: DNA helicase [Pikeienuella sp.]